MVHNALPNRVTGTTPTHAMFGIKIADPRFRQHYLGDGVNWQSGGRREALAKMLLTRAQEHEDEDSKSYRDFEVGMYVVHSILPGERKALGTKLRLPAQMVPKAGAPVLITKVNPSTLEVVDVLGGTPRTVPKRICQKVLGGPDGSTVVGGRPA